MSTPSGTPYLRRPHRFGDAAVQLRRARLAARVLLGRHGHGPHQLPQVPAQPPKQHARVQPADQGLHGGKLPNGDVRRFFQHFVGGDDGKPHDGRAALADGREHDESHGDAQRHASDASIGSHIHLYVGSAIHLSIGSPIHLSVGSPIHLSVGSPVHLTVGSPIHLSVGSPVHLTVGSPIHLSVGAPIHLSVGSPIHLQVLLNVMRLTLPERAAEDPAAVHAARLEFARRFNISEGQPVLSGMGKVRACLLLPLADSSLWWAGCVRWARPHLALRRLNDVLTKYISCTPRTARGASARTCTRTGVCTCSGISRSSLTWGLTRTCPASSRTRSSKRCILPRSFLPSDSREVEGVHGGGLTRVAGRRPDKGCREAA